MSRISDKMEALLKRLTGMSSVEIINSHYTDITPEHDINTEGISEIRGSVALFDGRIFTAKDIAEWHDK